VYSVPAGEACVELKNQCIPESDLKVLLQQNGIQHRFRLIDEDFPDLPKLARQFFEFWNRRGAGDQSADEGALAPRPHFGVNHRAFGTVGVPFPGCDH
jgi:hypothetical protein